MSNSKILNPFFCASGACGPAGMLSVDAPHPFSQNKSSQNANFYRLKPPDRSLKAAPVLGYHNYPILQPDQKFAFCELRNLHRAQPRHRRTRARADPAVPACPCRSCSTRAPVNPAVPSPANRAPADPPRPVPNKKGASRCYRNTPDAKIF